MRTPQWSSIPHTPMMDIYIRNDATGKFGIQNAGEYSMRQYPNDSSG